MSMLERKIIDVLLRLCNVDVRLVRSPCPTGFQSLPSLYFFALPVFSFALPSYAINEPQSTNLEDEANLLHSTIFLLSQSAIQRIQ